MSEFENDYIMRLIREFIRAIIKAILNIDLEVPGTDILKVEQSRDAAGELYKRVEEGRINEAENAVYDLIETGGEEELKTALLFYSYLNEKEDDFLRENDFSREEIKQGLENVVSKYGLEGLADAFLDS